MFDSGITVKKCIEIIKNEIDITTPYEDDVYLRFINEVLQLLYSEIIKEEYLSKYTESDTINVSKKQTILDNFPVLSNIHRSIHFEDITKVYVNDILLSKSTISNVGIFPNIYYKLFDGTNNMIGFAIKEEAEEANEYDIKIYYNAVPVIYATFNYNDVNIPLPYEWLSLITSKVKGEIYKLVNEDNQAAKWLNEFNNQLESFKIWCANHYNSYLCG